MITPKEYIYNHHSIEKCLNEAVNTYVQLVEETSVDFSIMNDHVNRIRYIVFEECEYIEEYMIAKDLVKYSPVHTCEYDLTEEDLPERAFEGAIVVIKDGDKSLVIDGNHRRNTLLRLCPNQRVLVIEIYVKLPSNIEDEYGVA